MIVAALSLALVVVVCGVASSVWMQRTSANRTLSSLDEIPTGARIVLLGCPARSRSGAPNRYFIARVAAAAAAYHHAAPRANRAGSALRGLLCSGWDEEGEATELAEALIAAGVPSNEIALDGGSARTIDSIDYLAVHHPDDPIVFVSQAFHVPRVLYLARDRGLQAFGLCAEGRLRGLRPRLREVFARFRAIADLGLRSGRR
jgi:SanA protein